MNEYISFAEAARMLEISPQAIGQAAKRGNLKYVCKGRWRFTTSQWLKNFEKNRHDVESIKVCGKHLFNDAKGRFSVKRVAEILGTDRNFVYRLIFTKRMKFEKVGYYYIIHGEELARLQEMFRVRVKQQSA